MVLTPDEKRNLIESSSKKISITKQCNLLDLNRTTYYLKPAPESEENLKLMRFIDEEYTKHPFLGTRKMREYLKQKGHFVNRKRVQRLMRIMGIEAIYPKPKTTNASKDHLIYPYLLRDVTIKFSNQVWSSDITYIRMEKGFLYLTVILDWYSRYVIAWDLSNSLHGIFCEEVLKNALSKGGSPEIFNTDQGSQFTSHNYTNILKESNIKISMDSRGAMDNIFNERLWRSVKYEEVYLKNYERVPDVYDGIKKYFDYYNNERPHQSLKYKTPKEVYLCG